MLRSYSAVRRLGGQWWTHYVMEQVAAFAVGGRRSPGGPLALIRTNVWRFWPGVPFIAVALARAAATRWFPLPRRAVEMRVALLGAAALVLAGFASSGRSYWWYLMPAYPVLALLAGAGLEDCMPARVANGFSRYATRFALAAGLLLVALLPLKILANLERSCPFGDLPQVAHALAAWGKLIAIVSPEDEYSPQVISGEHCRCESVLVPQLRDAERPGLAGALVPSGDAIPAGWSTVANHGRWTRTRSVKHVEAAGPEVV
jgi:hypothetical protein